MVALLFAGRALLGRMSSQQGEDEGRAGHDAEFAECHAEASLLHHITHMLTLHFVFVLFVFFYKTSSFFFSLCLYCMDRVCQSAKFSWQDNVPSLCHVRENVIKVELA